MNSHNATRDGLMDMLCSALETESLIGRMDRASAELRDANAYWESVREAKKNRDRPQELRFATMLEF